VHWQWLAGAVLAFGLALVTTPVGVSGAVLLLPVQISVLGVASLAATPTNLLFNVIATPGGLARFGHEERLRGRLPGLLLAGTLPGVIVGSVVRVQWLSGASASYLIAACVLFPLGLWLILGGQRIPSQRRPVPNARILGVAAVVGTVGGVYGIGGGSLLAPVLLLWGFSAYEVAPATLLATFLTSIVGLLAFAVQGNHATPDWLLGVFLGAGGLVGSYCGARLQRRLPERSLRRLLGVLACVVAARYTQLAVATPSHPPVRQATA
jgi:uncharacterized protein